MYAGGGKDRLWQSWCPEHHQYDCWRKGDPERGGGRPRGNSLSTFGVHLKEWSTAQHNVIILVLGRQGTVNTTQCA